jgi:heterodisulfide reductase subunit B
MTREKLDIWEGLEADCITVVCPTCFEEFDLGQVQVSRQAKRKYDIAALYYLQLLGLAQGIDSTQLGLQLHKVKAKKVLEKLKETTVSGS